MNQDIQAEVNVRVRADRRIASCVFLLFFSSRIHHRLITKVTIAGRTLNRSSGAERDVCSMPYYNE